MSTASSGRSNRRERDLDQLGDYESGPDASIRATAAALERAASAAAVVLVEGISDQIAIEALAERLGRDLGSEGIVIVPIGGAQAIDQYVARFAEGTARIVGLCDRAEAGFFARAFGSGDDFAVCDPDLEAELIAALDEADIIDLLESQNDLRSFRTMQKQPEWRERAFPDQIHRWVRSHARRSLRYARLFVLATDDERLPQPLLQVLHRV